jgi:hypothetical protein
MSSFKKHKYFDIHQNQMLLRNKIYLTRIALFKKFGFDTTKEKSVEGYTIAELPSAYHNYMVKFKELDESGFVKKFALRIKGFILSLIKAGFREKIAGRKLQ